MKMSVLLGGAAFVCVAGGALSPMTASTSLTGAPAIHMVAVAQPLPVKGRNSGGHDDNGAAGHSGAPKNGPKASGSNGAHHKTNGGKREDQAGSGAPQDNKKPKASGAHKSSGGQGASGGPQQAAVGGGSGGVSGLVAGILRSAANFLGGLF